MYRFVSVGDVVQCSYDPPDSVMVYRDERDGKFMLPDGFDLVRISTLSSNALNKKEPYVSRGVNFQCTQKNISTFHEFSV